MQFAVEQREVHSSGGKVLIVRDCELFQQSIAKIRGTINVVLSCERDRNEESGTAINNATENVSIAPLLDNVKDFRPLFEARPGSQVLISQVWKRRKGPIAVRVFQSLAGMIEKLI